MISKSHSPRAKAEEAERVRVASVVPERVVAAVSRPQ